jgi:hypothetical protein
MFLCLEDEDQWPDVSGTTFSVFLAMIVALWMKAYIAV